ncbi:DUF6308 family protein [Streptomyces olivaceoviridis]|uniref:DUF6308 family protein n=1 Tax=Streptomyces olivaceoviridis TaxID=1921 RepID=UPI00368EDC41
MRWSTGASVGRGFRSSHRRVSAGVPSTDTSLVAWELGASRDRAEDSGDLLDDEKAVSLLGEYFTRRRSCGDLFYSGACFERLGGGGGGDAEHVADRFDGNDLVAITTLSVSLDPHRAINLLTDPDGHWARLLSLIPRDARLEDPRSDALIAEGGPAWELWERLAGTKRHPGKPDGSGSGCRRQIAGPQASPPHPHLRHPRQAAL